MTIEQPARQELLAPATQIVRDRSAYLGDSADDIGRRVADDQVELFVAGDPAASLAQQIARAAPRYIALHDVGAASTLRLLAALAGSAKARVQRFSIRRQGHGLALATIPFVEIPIGERRLRVYSTDVDADGATRRALAQVLLSHATLAALMVAELPPHALAAALDPLRDAIARGPWPNRELLLLPLGSATALATLAGQLPGASGVSVRVTPHAARPADAWAFVGGAWNRLGGVPVDTDLHHALPPSVPSRADAPTQPMGLEPPRAAPAPQASPLPTLHAPSARWDAYAERCTKVRGVLGCTVFDVGSRRVLAHAGSGRSELLAAQGQALHEAATATAKAMGFSPGAPEADIAVGEQHLMLRALPGHPATAAALLLQGPAGNITLARVQLDRVSFDA